MKKGKGKDKAKIYKLDLERAREVNYGSDESS
jgi:hypothetical protein